MIKPYPIKFMPVPQERIWGGKKLKQWFNIDVSYPIGEYWVLSGHPSGPSVVKNGPMAGKTLMELVQKYPKEYLGSSIEAKFPLLIKFIEAKEDLSVQIHPDDKYAAKAEGDLGKTEAWYILDSKQGGKIIYGHNFKNRKEYKEAIAHGKVKEFLKFKDIKPGELIYVPSRTLHALLSGTIVIEIQQSSDITYRVYDWDRIDKSGKSRELHIEKAADVMVYDESPRLQEVDNRYYILNQAKNISHVHLLTSPYFSIEKLSMKNDKYLLKAGKSGNPDILIIIDGQGDLIWDDRSLTFERADALLIPSSIKHYVIKTNYNFEALRVFY